MSESEQRYEVGDTFPVQFVWRLPSDNLVRAVFRAEVLDVVVAADKYMVRLAELLSGREETAAGEFVPKAEMSKQYWALVVQLIERKATIAFEAANGRIMQMRLSTLTGEHDFFYRY